MANCNTDIKLAAAGRGVYLWQIAERMNIADTSLSRKLRHELPDEEKERIMEIICDIAGEAE